MRLIGAGFPWFCTVPHGLPQDGNRHLYREVTVTRLAKSFESRTLGGFSNVQTGQNAVVYVTGGRDSVPGVAATRPGSSPFRRSESPGTCAIRPVRVDYGQCFAHARGWTFIKT